MADRVSAPAQQSLQLILARNLISTLSTAAFLVDPGGTVVFYNDSAGEFLGMHYEETGKVPLSDWRAAIEPADMDGHPIDEREMPIAIALREGRPVHTRNLIRAAAGARRSIEILALPLIGPEGQHEGVIAVFWPHMEPPE